MRKGHHLLFVLALLGLCTVGHSSVRQWTSSGDDGDVGYSAGHVMVWALDSLTIVNADAGRAGWTQIEGLHVIPASELPAHTLAGTQLTYDLSDADLPNDTTIFVSVKAFDEANNYSALGNILRVETPDTIQPAAIFDLR